MKIKVGSLIKVKSRERCIEDFYNVGGTYEVMELPDDLTSSYKIYTADKNDWWYFLEHELELV